MTAALSLLALRNRPEIDAVVPGLHFSPVRNGLAAALSLMALIAAAPSLAAQIDVESRIDRITVYPDAAQASRIAEVELPAGAHSLTLRGLPINLDPDSLRVEGAGEGRIAIGSVETRVAPAPKPEADTGLAGRLKELQDNRATLVARISTLQAKKAMIERYAQASPEKLGDKSAPLDVGQWTNAWNAVGEGLAKVAAETLTAQQSLIAIDQEIRAVQASNRPSPQRIGPSREATIEIEAANATKARLVVTYRVAGAGWRPHYDARLSVGESKPSLELIRRAAVSQRTGEDWKNVALTVSTVRAQRGVAAPDVLVERLKFFEPRPRPMVMSRPAPAPAARARQYENKDGVIGAVQAPAAPIVEAVREQEAELETGAYEAQFRVPGRVDIPGDGSSRSVRLGSSTIEPSLSVRVSPAIDTTAYLEVSFTNGDDAPLLPGAVNIQRDGMFVGRGFMKLVAPGDETRLGFGADDAVKVTRTPIRRRESGPGWMGATRTEVKDFRTIVRNLHKFPVNVYVADRIPISEDSSISIEPLSTNTPPTEKTVEGRRGVMGWRFDLAPQAQKEVRLGWQIKWPNDKRLMSETLPDGLASSSASP